MAFINRYSKIIRGDIVLIGNTLGLSKLANENKAGTLGSIGAFTSLDTTLKVNDFPNGTTLDYTKNGSSNKLDLPNNIIIDYAELIWCGLYKSTQNDITSLIDNPIIFGLPNGTEVSITPDTTTKQNLTINLTNGKIYSYVRSANVTNKITTIGNYYVKKIPALIEKIDDYTNQANHAGWTLAIVYKNSNLPIRSVNLWVGGTVVNPLVGVTDVTISGFLTPDTAAPNGRLTISAAEGDATISGDQLLFGKDALNLKALSGVNNPINNFFCSQINDINGYLKTDGTFGSRNANALTGTNSSAVRQGYDITSVDLSGKLSAAQDSALVRFTSSGDMYLPNCLALQIDNTGYSNLEVVKSANKKYAVVGDTILYTITIKNIGTYNVTEQTFIDTINQGSEFETGSVYINGTNYPSYNPQSGFPLPSLNVGESIIVTFKVKIK